MVRTLRAKLSISAAVFVAVCVIGWVLPLTPPAAFEAAARVWMQTRIETGTGDGSKSSSMFQSFMSYFNSPILTACEVLKSTLVLEEAAKNLKTKLPPDQVPTVEQLKTIKVEPVQNTDLISVSYKDKDAWAATTIVQAILDAFASLESQQAAYSAIQSQTFLQQQLMDSQKELQLITEKIKRFQHENGIIDLPGEVAALVTQRAALGEAAENAKLASQLARSKSNYLSSHLGISPDDAIKASEAASDPAVMEAQRQLADLEFEYSSLSGQLRPEHPRMRQLTGMIAQLKAITQKRIGHLAPKLRLAAPMAAEVSGMGGPNGNASNMSLSSGILKDMVTAKTDEVAENARQSLILGAQSSLDKQLKTLPEKQYQLADLLRAQKVIFERISGLEASINEAKLIQALNTSSSNFKVVDRPQIVNVVVASKRPKLLTAALLGLVLSAITFFALDILDPRLRRVASILSTLPLPVIGWADHLSLSGGLEALHRLRLSLRPFITDKHKQFVVTSCDEGDGKSTVAAGLAMSFAQVGKRVLLIDANLEHPSLNQIFKSLPSSPGLADYLSAPDPQLLSKIMIEAGPNLHVIPAGSKGAGGRILSSDALPRLMQQAESAADIVIYDTPATSESSAALALLSPAVNLLVVVRLNHTHQPALQLLATELKRHDCASSNLVLVNVDDYAVASALAKNEEQAQLEPA